MDKFIDIAQYTTFNLSSYAGEIVVFDGNDIKNTIESINKKNRKLFILGGGSNIILPKDMTSFSILKIENKGIEKISEDENNVILRVASGEVWDDVVKYSVDNNYSGIEALSAIPGIAGATPIQNVGAYGQEIKDVLIYIEAYDLEKGELVNIKNAECDFGYRMSKFKKEWKNRFVITHIIIKLCKSIPTLPNYPGVKKYFIENNINDVTLLQIRNAIINIRWSKLPKPEELPNCGSFFENPIVDIDIANKLKIDYPTIPSFCTGPTCSEVKIPAGWLIENAGLKGVNLGAVGTYDKNALVLINLGSATQDDVIKARDHIIKTVYDKFGITLQSEPEIVS